MNNLFPWDQYACVGRKYQLIGKNQFRNNQLREIINYKPDLNNHFNCYIGDPELEFNFDQITKA